MKYRTEHAVLHRTSAGPKEQPGGPTIAARRRRYSCGGHRSGSALLGTDQGRRTVLGLVHAALLFPATAGAQLAVDTMQTPEQLVQDILVADGISVSNVTFAGLPGNVGNRRIGSFDGTNSNVGLTCGVILGSGDASFAIGPNTIGSGSSGGGDWGFDDPDLEQLSGVPTHDAAYLEFDFIPIGDSIRMNYVFGSEEYNEYVCGTVNDVFGFFLSGPGISGPFTNGAINIALVPGSQVPVSINTVNNGTVGTNGTASNCEALDPDWQNNSIYFNGNTNGTTVQYDGMTTVLTARAAVVPGQTYHIKIAIADGGDTAFDSGVFLEGGSFSSNRFIPVLRPDAGVLGPVIFESCLPVTIDFIRVGDISQPDTAYFIHSGTAAAGVDYMPALPDTLLFASGQDSIPVQMQVPVDGDGDETIGITLLVADGCNGQPFPVTYTYLIQSLPELEVNTNGAMAACGDSVDLTATISGGLGLYGLLWNTGDTSAMITVTATGMQDFTVIASDTCGLAPDTAFASILLSPPPPIALNIFGAVDLVEGIDSTVIRVSRPLGTTAEISVQLDQNGSATNGSDHSAIPGQLTIPIGINEVDVMVVAFEDGVPEGLEPSTITGSYTDPCGQLMSTSVTITISDTLELGLQERDQLNAPTEVTVHPNPATELVQVALSAGGILRTVEVQDALGRVVHRQALRARSAMTLEVAAWPAGCYLVRVEDQRGRRGSARFIKH